jgi:hypothetical protein
VTRPFLLVAVGLAGGLIGCLFIGACALPVQRREDALMRTAREFNDGIRWGRDDSVLDHLTPTEAQGLQGRRAALGDDFVMADQEVKSMKILEGSDKATVVAEFTWFDQRRGVVQKSTVEEHWEWRENVWLVASWRRVGGARFPLVPEPVAPAAGPGSATTPSAVPAPAHP